MQDFKVGIVGGKGSMGSLFARLLSAAGVEVEVSDLGTELSNADIIRRCTVVLFSLPLAKTPQLISDLAPTAREDQLLVDITSLKAAPISSMLKSAAAVLGLHPMFGPNIKNLENQLILVCHGRKSKLSQSFLDLLSSLGARLKETTPEKHDKVMSVVQGFNHLGSIIAAAALQEMKTDLKESLEYASPAFRIRMDLISRILAQDGDLYADIALENSNTADVLSTFIANAEKVLEIVKRKDKPALVALFESLGSYFGDVKEAGLKSSNKLIEALLKSE